MEHFTFEFKPIKLPAQKLCENENEIKRERASKRG